MRNQPSPSRRQFLKTTVGLGAVASGLAGCQTTASQPKRRKGARYMGDFAADPIPNLRVGFIGTGARGSGHVAQMLMMEGVEVVGICDTDAAAAAGSAKRCVDAGRKAPGVYDQGEHDFLRMLDEVPMDAVLVATPWRWHAPMGVAAMERGVHAFLEVPMAPTLDELWQLVDTSEQTGKHCMMMENVCYGREELMFLNMVRQGVLGELTYGEGAYIHDLRSQMHEDYSEGLWRVDHHTRRNGNLYPTHGLGPIAQYMGCERGLDRFERLVSFSSPALGRALQAKRDFPADHPRNQATYICGDMNMSLIKTQRGRTILVQHDTTSPRPYTRLNMISGTLGTLAGFPTRVALDPEGKGAHGWLENEALEPIYERYEHPLYQRVGEEARKAGGHGGMDFIMLWRIAYCLRNGLPLDQNVYEGAAWSAVSPLSEASVAADGMPQVFPDFTRGQWVSTQHLQVIGA
ncbi:MAG TPA: Gfo/Idh/MocA family oxidoreductase [Planctomycetota bacterium]|nr:Gfo/Idh/MocA family oxidoreductase [Planctomycetota bacterium]HRV80819.1 Gfo/Idh/MocA family oxidoreductase [Planctomycetota bacterium]